MSQPDSNRFPFQAWLQLVRLPNLFSVPGDVLAGAFFALAAGGSFVSPAPLLMAVVAAVAVYAAGLIDNDRVDFAEDLRDRPGRPLPSGRIPKKAAGSVCLLLFAVPFLITVTGTMPPSWVGVQVLLVAAVVSYNRVKARFPVSGFLLMGLCRGLDLLAGATLAGPGVAWGAVAAVALCWTVYVAGFTVFASHETRRAPGALRYLLVVPVGALGLVAGISAIPWRTAFVLAAAAVAGMAGAWDALRACPPGPDPARVPRTVGRLVRLLIPLQALLCLAGPPGPGRLAAAGFLLACWVLAERVGRRFYAS